MTTPAPNDAIASQPPADKERMSPFTDLESVMFLSVELLLWKARQYGCECEVQYNTTGGLVCVVAPTGYRFVTNRCREIIRDLPHELGQVQLRRQVVADLLGHMGAGFYREPPQPPQPQPAPGTVQSEYEVSWTGEFVQVVD